MNDDPVSLSNLRDIVTPPPVSWHPLALGWWFLFASLAFMALFFAVRAGRRWRSNAYRRAALRELHAASDAASIAEVLKRTALAASSRTKVASLTGARWVEWLAETGGRPVPAVVIRVLTIEVFADNNDSGDDSDDDEDADLESLTRFAAEWIKSHRVASLC